ncbi:hypothetical protein [Malonomonas rubra]|uniref:hypothetical protein n=1 Tax=Malonomonas rubra TaxID=57040 RepID=UPI0026F1DC87|nr:hypothetical protein [Malonomonas rubra]
MKPLPSYRENGCINRQYKEIFPNGNRIEISELDPLYFVTAYNPEGCKLEEVSFVLASEALDLTILRTMFDKFDFMSIST